MSVPLAGSEPGTLSAYGSSFARRLSHARVRPPRRVSKWFRYPHQGRAGWLRQVKFKGEIWRDEQLSVLPALQVDRDAFITGVIKGKLAYLGGRVDGQTITIDTRRCARIELSVPEGLVDLDKPVTVLCNGRKRFEGILRRSVRTLLEAAYRDWKFEHPPVARLSLSIKTDGSGSG